MNFVFYRKKITSVRVGTFCYKNRRKIKFQPFEIPASMWRNTILFIDFVYQDNTPIDITQQTFVELANPEITSPDIQSYLSKVTKLTTRYRFIYSIV